MEGNKKIKLLGIFAIGFCAVLFFGNINSAQAIEFIPGEGMLVYGDGFEFSTATISDNTGLNGTGQFGKKSSVSAGTLSPGFTRIITSPTRKEALVINQSIINTKLEVLRWNGADKGASWSLEWTENKVGSGSTTYAGKAFAAAYETSSSSAGEAVIAWAKTKGTTGGENGVSNSEDNAIEYKVWDGTSWGNGVGGTATTSYDLSVVGASISWMEFYQHPASGSNQSDLVLCYQTGTKRRSAAVDIDGHVGCLVWDGNTNTFGNEKRVTSAPEEDTRAGDAKTFDGFYEQGSGNFIAVATVEGASTLAHVTLNGSWSVASTSFTTGETSGPISCSAMPYVAGLGSTINNSNNDGICVMHDPVADDVSVQDWDGNATNNFVDTTANTFDTGSNTNSWVGRDGLSSGWLINGTAKRLGLGIFDEVAAAVVRFGQFDAAAGGDAVATNLTVATAPVGAHQNIRFYANPNIRSRGIILTHDANGDLNVLKASISTGTTVSGGDLKLRAAASMGTAAASTASMSADFSYFNYASPSQTHFKWFSDDGSINSTTPISAEDIPASGSEALQASTSYRLRFEISNEGPASASNNKYSLQMARQKTGSNVKCNVLSPGWTWRTVPLIPTAASDAFDIDDSLFFADGASISSNGTLTASDPVFTPGYALDARHTSGPETLNGNNYSEFEYNIQPNSNANTSATYCFRLARYQSDGVMLSSVSYDRYATASVQAAPSVTYTQNTNRWYNNADDVQPGSAYIAENANLELDTKPTALRLRINVTVAGAVLASSSQRFKLQYTTNPGGAWTDVGDGIWGFYNNATPADGAEITTALQTGSDTEAMQSYNESNGTYKNPNRAKIGQDAEFDWSLDPSNAVFGKLYYFRMVRYESSTPFSAYTNYASVRFVNDGSRGVNQGGGGHGGSEGGGSGGSGSQGGGNPGGGHGGSEGGESGGGGSQSGGGAGGGGGESPVIFDWNWLLGWLLNRK